MRITSKQIEDKLQREILPFVSKPGRYVGHEYNVIQKDAQRMDVRVALAFPDVYEIGMSYIGFEILYHVLNREDHIWAERVYAPWFDMEERMRKEQLPLYALESFTPLKDFDIIGFTMQYELTYTNILNMLDLAGIPLWSNERSEEDPFIFGGGPCSCNPEPMAEFMDAFLIGDGEEGLVDMCNVVHRARKQGLKRKEILLRLAGLRGVYVPSLYETEYDNQGRFKKVRLLDEQAPQRILSRILPELKKEYYPARPIVPLLGVTHDRLSLEVMRGCTEGCRFCNAGMIYRPVREREVDDILSQMERNLKETGYEEVSFLSLSISDYSHLNDLMSRSRSGLKEQRVNASFPSMRLDSFSREIAEFVSETRKSGFTFAPEAGSERLRRVINKNISEQDLYNSVRIALQNGWKLLKFYFMMGLPTETMEDIEAIADLIEKVVKLSKPYGRVNFNVSVSTFSPKAHTPFQWERQDTREELREKISILNRRFSRIRQARLSWRDPQVSLLECVLGRADRRMAKVIYQAWKQGASFDGWTENFKLERWLEAAELQGVPFDRYAQAFDPEQPLPWDHIDKGVSKSFLLKERRNAYRGKNVTDCKQGGCYACGIQRKNSFREFASCYRQGDAYRATETLVSRDESAKDSTVNPSVEIREIAGDKKQVRIQFQKSGYARYLSHLDIVRNFERACRRARIPLVYSQGFNPHPRMSFGPPLALGYSSEAEFLDIEIEAAYEEDLIACLNPYLPQGLQILQYREIREKSPSLAHSITASEYEVDLPEHGLSDAAFNEALQNLLQRDEIQVTRRVKGKMRRVNIRPYIDRISRENRILKIKTKTIESRTVRVNEIIQELFHSQELDGRSLAVHRRRQYIRRGNRELTPLEVLS